ncbi:MAG: PadR family transcriptional regulator [Chloroflexota bacterium]
MTATGGARRRGARTLWSLAVMGLLRERAMHPYELQRQLHFRHTDELLALKRGSFYHAINQLQRDCFIEPIETHREGRWPERTVYRITPEGDEEFVVWLRDLLSTPVREPSHFTAALAHILQLNPTDALDQLHMRVVNLEATVAAGLAVERGVGKLIGRGPILELEYGRYLAQAELDWVRALIADLSAGRIAHKIDQHQCTMQIARTNLDKSTSQGDT